MKLTKQVVGGAVALLIMYEMWPLANAVPGDTISESIWLAPAKNPIIAFLAGRLCGHLFWQKSG